MKVHSDVLHTTLYVARFGRVSKLFLDIVEMGVESDDK